MVESARGVQQGCNLGPLCYSAGSLKILKEFKANPPVPGARAVSFPQRSPTHQTCKHGNPQNSCLHQMVEVWKWLSKRGEYSKDAI